jgi:cobalt-zinc-cadmium efflux system protein
MAMHQHVTPQQRSASSERRALALAAGLTAAVLVVEVVAGILTNSLALLADAGHMLSDAVALALALFASWFAARPATPEKTYGFYRVEILAALLNGAGLLVLGAGIIYGAWLRFLAPPPVLALPMLIVAVLGLAINVASAVILSRAAHGSLNVRGAFLHVLGDLAGSVGVILAALVMLATGWFQADPLVSVAIALLIMFSAWRLARESLNILLEGTPAKLNVETIRDAMASTPGVTDVHDLHVWALTSGVHLLTAHVAIQEWQQAAHISRELRCMLKERYAVEHSTLEFELAGSECPAYPVCPVENGRAASGPSRREP